MRELSGGEGAKERAMEDLGRALGRRGRTAVGGAPALAGALRLDWERNHRPKALALRSGGRTVSLPTAEIQYIESINRSVVVHLVSGEQAFPLTMTQAERLTPADLFARCHNSFLVNLAHVAEVGRAGVLLRSGAQLPVGRRYFQSFQTAFIRYLNR